MLHPLHPFFLLLFLTTSFRPADAYDMGSFTVLPQNGSAATTPVQDLFQFGTPPFARQGALILVSFPVAATGGCALTPFNASSHPYLPPGGRASETIIGMDLDEATQSGCRTFGEIAKAIEGYAPRFSEINLPAFYRTIIVHIDSGQARSDDDTTPFDPQNIIQYNGNGRRNDGPVPGIDFVILSTKAFGDTIAQATEPTALMVTVVSGPGPWNESFSSIDYRSFSIAMVILLTGLSAYLVWLFGPIFFRRGVVLELRNVTFLLAFLSIMASIPTYILRRQSYASLMCVIFSKVFSTLSLELFLFLWAGFLVRLNPRSWVRYTRHLIWLAVLYTLVNFSLHIYIRSVSLVGGDVLGGSKSAYFGILTVYPFVILILSAVCLYMITMFVWRCEVEQLSPQAKQTLAHLAILGVVAFITLVALASCNLLYFFDKIHTPTSLLWFTIVSSYALTIRDIVIVLVLGVRMPRMRYKRMAQSDPALAESKKGDGPSGASSGDTQ